MSVFKRISALMISIVAVFFAVILAAYIKDQQIDYGAFLISDYKTNANDDLIEFEYDGHEYAYLDCRKRYNFLCNYDDNGDVQAKQVALLKQSLFANMMDKAYVYEFDSYPNHEFVYCDMDRLGYSEKVYYRADIKLPELKADNIEKIEFDFDDETVSHNFCVTDKDDIRAIIDFYNGDKTSASLATINGNELVDGRYYATVKFTDWVNLCFDLGTITAQKSKANKAVLYEVEP